MSEQNQQMETEESAPTTTDKVESVDMIEEEMEIEPEEDPIAKAEALKEQGNTEFKAKNYYQAIDLYKLAIEANPSNAAYYNNCAAAQLALHQYNNAIKSCAKCLELDPKNVKAMVRKGKAHMAVGEATLAQDSFKDALVIDPTNNAAFSEKKEADLLAARIAKARESISEGNFNHALALAQAGLRQAPNSRELLLINVEGLIRAGDYDKAYAETTQMMRENQNDAKLLYYRGLCLYYQENFPMAIRHLQQALQLDPDYKLAQMEIKKIRKLERTKEEGNNFFKSRDYDKAIESYSNALEVDNENKSFNSKLHCNRAACYQKTKKFSEALTDCDKAIDLNPDYGKAYMRKGACLRELGGKENIERALACYETAERILGRTQDLQQAVRDAKLELKKAKRKDYYKVLELPNREDSTPDQIKKAYRKAALKWHPDRHTGDGEEDKQKAEAMFKDCGEAYEVLSDSSKKQKYDSGLTLEEIEQGGPMGGGHHNPEEIFQMFFGGGGMRGGGGGHPYGNGGHPFGGGGFHFG